MLLKLSRLVAKFLIPGKIQSLRSLSWYSKFEFNFSNSCSGKQFWENPRISRKIFQLPPEFHFRQTDWSAHESFFVFFFCIFVCLVEKFFFTENQQYISDTSFRTQNKYWVSIAFSYPFCFKLFQYNYVFFFFSVNNHYWKLYILYDLISNENKLVIPLEKTLSFF